MTDLKEEAFPSYSREQELLEEIERLNRTIESIKKQYDELMGVALQYREEAKKWYNKFISGKNF